jgi:DNA modification methylase
VTSPPYFGLRDYGQEGQIGLEETPELFISRLMEVFREVRRVLRSDGTLWLNIGDSYAGGGRGDGAKDCKQKTNHGSLGFPRQTPPQGLKSKDLIGIPWLLAFALRADGWYLRSEITWCKLAPMPESVRDRPTSATEKLFLLTKSPTYFYDQDAVKVPSVRPGDVQTFGGEKGRNYNPTSEDPNFRNGKEQWGRSVECSAARNLWNYWILGPEPSSLEHYAGYPTRLVEPCILAGSAKGDLVLDPFTGSGTTGEVALAMRRRFIGIELNPEYAAMARRRIDILPSYTGAKRAKKHVGGQLSLMEVVD